MRPLLQLPKQIQPRSRDAAGVFCWMCTRGTALLAAAGLFIERGIIVNFDEGG